MSDNCSLDCETVYNSRTMEFKVMHITVLVCAHMHARTRYMLYIYIRVCVCVCAHACVCTHKSTVICIYLNCTMQFLYKVTQSSLAFHYIVLAITQTVYIYIYFCNLYICHAPISGRRIF